MEVIESDLTVPVEIHFDRISGGLTFALVRSRAQAIAIGGQSLRVAALRDVIRSKEAANRPKDIAVLPVLRNALAILEKK